MENRERPVDRLRVYPSDGKKVRILAKTRGGKTTPADVIRALLSGEKK
jgi:hypothetical protein